MGFKSQQGQSLIGVLITATLASIAFAGAMNLFGETARFTKSHEAVMRHDKQLMQALTTLELEVMGAGYGIEDAEMGTHIKIDDNDAGRLLWRQDTNLDGVLECVGVDYGDGTMQMLTAENCDAATDLSDIEFRTTDTLASFPETREKPLPDITYTVGLADCAPFGFGTPVERVVVDIVSDSAMTVAREQAGVGNLTDGQMRTQICIVNIAG